MNRTPESLRVGVRLRLDRLRVDRRLREVCDDAGTPATSGARSSLDASKKFMDFQLRLNMTDRGWLETTYYQLGTDYRGGMSYLLSYMSQMGGWSILDHALHFAAGSNRLPAPGLRLVAELVGAGQLRHEGERLRLLVPEPGERRRHRRRVHGRRHGPRLDRQGDAARRVVLQRGGGRGLLRRAAHARDDRGAGPDLRRIRLRRRADPKGRVGERDSARRSARRASTSSATISGCTWCWTTMATRRSSPWSSRTTCRGSRLRWRTAPAARTRPGSPSPGCRPATIPSPWTEACRRHQRVGGRNHGRAADRRRIDRARGDRRNDRRPPVARRPRDCRAEAARRELRARHGDASTGGAGARSILQKVCGCLRGARSYRPGKVPDAALLMARDIVNFMLSKRPDVRAVMVEQGKSRHHHRAKDEMQTDPPEYRDMEEAGGRPTARLTPRERENYDKPGGIGSMTDREYWNRRARGMGGNTSRRARRRTCSAIPAPGITASTSSSTSSATT